MTLSAPVSAEDENLFKGKSYGSFMFFEEVPNALFFEAGIANNDSFEFRKAIRNHDINTIVLSSPGGALFEGLTIAGMIFDKELTTYVPKTGRCASACAFMFFAGKNRQATGRLGVHQFYSTSDDKTAKIANVEYGSQFTVSEIIGYLNEFETPPFVFEKMFAQKQMYFFSDDELAKLNNAPTDAATIANFSKIDEFVVKAKEATKQAKAEAVEVETTVEVKDNDDLALRKQIQAELNRIGCTLGRVDGKIGPASKRALSRFNKQNKSSYGVRAFFNDKSQLNKLRKISSGFCSPIVVQAKVKDEDTTFWRGQYKCAWFLSPFELSAQIRKTSESSITMSVKNLKNNIIWRPVSLSKRADGKYFGIKTNGCGLGPDKVFLDIDFIKGKLTGKTKLKGLVCNGIRAAFLMYPQCKWDMTLVKDNNATK
jgi:hypothetical protein